MRPSDAPFIKPELKDPTFQPNIVLEEHVLVSLLINFLELNGFCVFDLSQTIFYNILRHNKEIV